MDRDQLGAKKAPRLHRRTTPPNEAGGAIAKPSTGVLATRLSRHSHNATEHTHTHTHTRGGIVGNRFVASLEEVVFIGGFV